MTSENLRIQAAVHASGENQEAMMEAADEIDRLTARITGHNLQCDSDCESSLCGAWKETGHRCSSCPKDYKIALEAK